VKYEDHVIDEAGLILVTEYLPLGNLKQLNDRQKLSREEARTCLRQILEAVKYLHSQGITHRDIKPANILVQFEPPELFVKLCDFGLSKLLKEDEYLKTYCGTGRYTAAEVFTGKYTKSVDIWSAGVVTYELIKRLPERLEEDDQTAWSKKIRGAVDELNRRDPMSQILKKMLSLKPNDRPSAEHCLQERWIQSSQPSYQKDASSTEYFIAVESGQSTEILDLVTEQPTEIMDPKPEVKGKRALKPQKRIRSSGSSSSKSRTRKKGLSEVPQGATSTGGDSMG
jgi:serine/threonine protein kinase